MDFTLNASQREVIAHTETVAQDMRARQGPNQTPDEALQVWKVAAEGGLTGLCLPREFGGSGLGALDTALALEALTRCGVDLGTAFALGAHLLACGIPIRNHAVDETRSKLMASMAEGGVAANAMTEDEAGSDTASIVTQATRHGLRWSLRGEKSWVSNAPISDLLVTYAVTEPGMGYLGISAFVVDTNDEGVNIGSPIAKAGLFGCLAARVQFDNCQIDSSRLLGRVGQGHAIFGESMLWERACLPAIYLGAMQADIDATLDHIRTRKQFRRRLADHQSIRHRVARLAIQLEAARLHLYRACWMVDNNDAAAPAAAAMAKVAVSEAATTHALASLHIAGAQGYAEPSRWPGRLMDAVAGELSSGSTEMQLEVICQRLV